MFFYLKLPLYIIPYVNYIYGTDGRTPLCFHPCTPMYDSMRRGLVNNTGRVDRGSMSFSQWAVDEVRRHHGSRAVNSTNDMPDIREIPELVAVSIPDEFCLKKSAFWCLTAKAATRLIADISTEFWRVMINAVQSECVQMTARGEQPNRLLAIERFLHTYGIDPDMYIETVYRLYSRRLTEIRNYAASRQRKK